MKVLCFGSRDWCNQIVLRDALLTLPPGATIVHGGARGADTIADKIARALGFKVRVYPADWATHGKAAGPIRNSQMLAEEHPDVEGVPIDKGFAFSTHLSTSRGTLDMARKAAQRGIQVTVFNGQSAQLFTV